LKVCIVSHDAGGAEILASYVLQNEIDCQLVLDGPAVGVFQRRVGQFEPHSLQEAISSCDWCLVGTSWQSDLEWRAIGEARRLGKRVVAFLDHWVNYSERFERNGMRHLPDEIWVGDEDAETIARTHFPETPIRLVPNPYFAYVRAEIAEYERRTHAKERSEIRVLYVCENISEHARVRHGDSRYWGYTEFDALNYFFARLASVGVGIGRVTVRPHPSDPPGKYADLVSRHAPVAVLSSGRPLLEEIVESDIVAGCESMALVVATLANKRVLCTVPPGPPIRLFAMRSGIELLRDLPVNAPA
jgi:hypothetical protein